MASNIKKVYLAILNCGELRREMSSTVIQAMNATPGVKLIWENPSKTWANPISSNRNMITKRFLESDCDFLLMIDDDVVPLSNPCELVHSNLDVVAMPALVRSSGNLLNWTAYKDHSGGVGYSAVDLDSVDDMFDILEVAIVGTGCILVKREVLENVKAPFHSEFDGDGIQTYGTDFAFCRRATKAGYKVYTTVHRRCEHFKVVGLSDVTAWDTINYFDKSNTPYGMFWGGFSLTQKDWRFIKEYLNVLQPKKILEFGSGLSSLLMSETCEVVSYETDPEHKKLIESKITSNNNLTVRLWDGHNFPHQEELELNTTSFRLEKFDFAFVDGPRQKADGGIGRDVSIKIAALLSDHVILHDAGRMEEEKHQRAYLRSIFKLERKSGDHITRCHYWKRRPHPVTLAELTKAKK